MLGYWRPHEQFQLWLEQKLLSFIPEHEKQIRFYAEILEKVYVLNLDRLLPLALSRYSSTTGRPAQNQPEIFRALVVMSHYKVGPGFRDSTLLSSPFCHYIFTRTMLLTLADFYGYW